MEKKIYSSRQVAQILKIKPHRLRYAIENGDVSDASSTFAGKKVFTQEDIQRLKMYFDGKRKEKK